MTQMSDARRAEQTQPVWEGWGTPGPWPCGEAFTDLNGYTGGARLSRLDANSCLSGY